MTDIKSVSRRYFVIGYFDGVLTVLGMIMGAHLSGEASSRLIISAGVATALALGISSAWGAYEAERIEQNIMKSKKEKALLVDSRGCLIDRAHKFASYVSSAVHGIAPIIAAMVPIVPYILLPENEAFYLALILGLSSLFVVGSAVGKIAKFNILISGLRMVLAGLVTMIVVTLLSPSHFI
jgi:predicted membrane protein (TIGR00267 family)